MSQLEHNISNAVTEPYLRLHDNEAVVHLPHNDDTNAKKRPKTTQVFNQLNKNQSKTTQNYENAKNAKNGRLFLWQHFGAR